MQSRCGRIWDVDTPRPERHSEARERAAAINVFLQLPRRTPVWASGQGHGHHLAGRAACCLRPGLMQSTFAGLRQEGTVKKYGILFGIISYF